MLKYQLLTVAVALAPITIYAQHGTVYFDEISKLEYELPEEVKNMEGMEELLAQFPKHNTLRHILTFDATASVMRQDKAHLDSLMAQFDPTKLMEDYNPNQLMALGMAFMNSIDTEKMDISALPVELTYTNFDEEAVTEQRNILDRRFLVTRSMEPLSWKLTGQERSFLGHRILQAKATQDTVSVEAWFTPEIPVPAGPALYSGLPGLILLVILDDGDHTFTATRVDLSSAPDVVRPANGQEVTLEEFEQIAEEKNAEMRAAMSRMRNTVFDF